MDTALEITGSILSAVWRFTLFVLVSIIFLPAFFIVTYLQDYWSKKLGELFGI